MKRIRKNLAILTLALFGLGIIGNNVLYGTDAPIEAPPDDGGGSGGHCGNPHHLEDHYLRLKTCFPLVWQQKLICDPMEGVCCDTAEQEPCSGSGFPDF